MNQKLLFTFIKTASPVCYCVLSIGMGTRNEDPKYNGLAHLTEHMLFKGTPNRSSIEISNTLEKVGGDMNAFTTKERIVLYTTTLKEDLKKALELVFEVACNSSFPADELKKEKVVVCDEIITYLDSPTELLFDTFENELFAGTPLGYSILGEKKSLDRISSATLKKYREQYFIPSNMTLTIAGNFEEKSLKELIDAQLHKYHKGAELLRVGMENPRVEKIYIPLTSKEFYKTNCNTAAELSKGTLFNKTEDKKLRQAHCILGCSAYSYFNTTKKTALSLITNILGGPALNSRLSMSLREKHALVYNVEASYISYKDTGVFSIYFGCEKEYLERCIALVKKEIDKIVNTTMSVRALNAAKKQMIGQISIASDNVEAQCLARGKTMLLKGEILSMEQLRESIEKVTPEQIREVAAEVLDWNRMSRLVFI